MGWLLAWLTLSALVCSRCLESCDVDDVSALQYARAASESHTHGDAVYVMLPLDVMNRNSTINDPEQLNHWFEQLRGINVTGVMTDVWWGITEPAPKEYAFQGYKDLVRMVKRNALKLQIVTSFHSCGSSIPLPAWLLQEEGIWYQDAQGDVTKAYISLWADHVQVRGRTPLQMYADWMEAFKAEFHHDLGRSKTIVDIMVGLGTDGELKYPSYENGNPEDPWQFPGIGEFQCYDPHARRSLQRAAEKARVPWTEPPKPEVTGTYNSLWNDTVFFTEGYKTPRGKFFLSWYAGSLYQHAHEVLRKARHIFGCSVHLTAKVSGVHWMYKTPSHAAEVTAGYYNANDHTPYVQLATIFHEFGARFDFTCMEMTDAAQPAAAFSGPQELVGQVITATRQVGTSLTGENALATYNTAGYNQMLVNKPALLSLTYLRLGQTLMEEENLRRFSEFVRAMQAPEFITPYSLE
ncbi:unnamed protein product [Effrenium voratum]|uniref:Beta-amylase n=2 Tax=Effrenium voratum TaxID=2562239 RepID=A0AA36JR56_9DINO|nr:unnamed protein product [Effrenium voratum]CAJ1452682.1 unnamed protein product [Effrenium voratum]